MASVLADTGNVAIVALVSPMAADRAWARELHEQADLDFFEVWVDTPLEVCERRDPAGLYRRAYAGELTNFTGVDGALRAAFGAGAPAGDGRRLGRRRTPRAIVDALGA